MRPVLSVPVSSSSCLQVPPVRAEGLLQGTPYALDSHEIKVCLASEERLMTALLAEYQWAFEPLQSDLVNLFTLKYHNLKVYLKNKATERKLRGICDPHRSLFS